MIDSACEDSLTQAYGVFAHEARSVKPDYKPNTVNTDGWLPKWKYWFPKIAVILCFLHNMLIELVIWLIDL